MKLQKVVGKSPNYQKNAELYLKNILVVKNSLPKMDINKGIDWSIHVNNNKRTFQVYLHSLLFVKDLVYTYEINKQLIYLKKARDAILDWYFNYCKMGNSEHAWNEHAASSRILNILFFQYFGDNPYKLKDSILEDLIDKHILFLTDEKNYKNNNHGIMMDNSLLVACYYSKINNKNLYIDKTLYRLKYAIQRDFTKKGTHLENSPEYHRLVLNLLSKSQYILECMHIELDNESKLTLKKASKVLSYMVMPSGEYPLIGDTGFIRDFKLKKEYIDFTDYDAGLGVYQFKNGQNLKESSYLSFKSGFRKITHKHFDELSVTLSLSGHNLLVDSGKYSYDSNDVVRQFLISPKAHSTIYIKNKHYKLNLSKSFSKAKISNFRSRGDNKIISGINNLYKGINITRNIIFNRKNFVFIVDKVNAESEERFIQNFNINENADTNRLSKTKYEINIDGAVYYIETFIQKEDKLISTVKKGFISQSFAKYNENNRIEFEIEDNKAIFVTVIYPEEHNNKIAKVSFEENNLEYYFENNKKVIIF